MLAAAVTVDLVEQVEGTKHRQPADDPLPGVLEDDGGEDGEEAIAKKFVVLHAAPWLEVEGGSIAVDGNEPSRC